MSKAIQLTHDNVTLSIREWADRTGITIAAIHRRLERKWPIAKILTTPNNLALANNSRLSLKISKNMAEMWLNDLPRAQVPVALQPFMTPPERNKGGGGLVGTSIRVLHREEFNKWYDNQYVKGILS